jgi:ComF family protein
MNAARGNWGRRLEVAIHPALVLFKELVDFVYPPACLLCGRRLNKDEPFVCRECRQKFEFIMEPVRDGQHYQRRMLDKVWFSHSVAFLQYSPGMQKLIHCLKYQNSSRLVELFGDEMGRRMMSIPHCRNADYLVPVPLHATRRRERGYNQSLLLAQRISRETGIPLLSHCLKRTRHTTQQAKLSGERRFSNVKGAFVASHPEFVKKRRLLVVDDVLTTGSTINECAQALIQAGAKQVVALTIVRI